MEKPLVSIIIPTYNYRRYLANATESALRQTYQNIEIIVVDDGSTDNTKDIAKEYPIRYFYQRHQGVAVALNNGIRLSHGDFFVCLGADDKLAPEFVKKTMEKIMEDPNIGFVRTGSILWNEETKVENILMPRKIYNKYAILVVGWIGALGTALIRRAAFDSLDDGFDVSLPAHEDVDLCFRLCLKGWKTGVVFEPLHWYRIHKSSRNPKTALRRKYAASFLDRKFRFRKICTRLYTLYQYSLGRVASLMSHPIEYLKGIKRKIKVNVWIRSYSWNNPINQERAHKLVQEIWLTIDMLIEWSRNKEFRDYYVKQLEILESRLHNLLGNDTSERNLFA